MQSLMSCPVCNEEEHVVPIEINIHKGTKEINFRTE